MTPIVQHAPESDRVRANTHPEVNARLDRQTELSLRATAVSEGNRIARRLEELDREWDLERVLEAEAASVGLTGLALGALVDKRFLIVPGFVASMVLLHALQGWYPLLPLFRRLGLRTPDEIDRERYGLKALRGDFAQVAADSGAEERADAVWRAVLA